MIIELMGGPFDGNVMKSEDPIPQIIVASGHLEKPVYRCTCCSCCAAKAEMLEYQFIGYERNLKKNLSPGEFE